MKKKIDREEMLCLLVQLKEAYKRYAKTNAEIGDYSRATEYKAKADILGFVWGVVLNEEEVIVGNDYLQENKQFWSL